MVATRQQEFVNFLVALARRISRSPSRTSSSFRRQSREALRSQNSLGNEEGFFRARRKSANSQKMTRARV